MEKFFSGQELYGNDFTPVQIEQWFADEMEGYADLGASDSKSYEYLYHGWNNRYGFSHMDAQKPFEKVLAFGSAYGDELFPIIDIVRSVTMVDPSDAFERSEIRGVPATYIQPSADGKLSLESSSHDLATCFGVLHHIPNVSAVLSDIARVLSPGSVLLLREPVVSMGDWRQPRPGLTKHERGIPIKVLRSMCNEAGFSIRHEALCGFSLTPRLLKPLTSAPYNQPWSVSFDRLLCAIFAWNLNYHATTPFQKLRPTSAFLVLEKS